MTTFYLIRHGEKDSDEALMVGRLPGVHLTAKGRRQAQAVARHLRGVHLDRIFSSPMERALETAGPLARAKRRKIEASPAFHEIDLGQWTGKTVRQLASVRSWRNFRRFPGGTAIPGGETLAEAQARVVSEMIRLREKYPAAAIAIATHEDPIRLAVCCFIGAPIEVYEHLTIRLGSLTVLCVDDQRVILDRMDELPAETPRRLGPRRRR